MNMINPLILFYDILTSPGESSWPRRDCRSRAMLIPRDNKQLNVPFYTNQAIVGPYLQSTPLSNSHPPSRYPTPCPGTLELETVL